MSGHRLGDDEDHVEGDDYEGKGNETDVTAEASLSAAFDTRSAFEAVLGRFDNLNTQVDSMEHKQDRLIVQVQQLQEFQHQHFQSFHPPLSYS